MLRTQVHQVTSDHDCHFEMHLTVISVAVLVMNPMLMKKFDECDQKLELDLCSLGAPAEIEVLTADYVADDGAEVKHLGHLQEVLVGNHSLHMKLYLYVDSDEHSDNA